MNDSPETSAPHKPRTASIFALQILEKLLLDSVRDKQHVNSAEVDLRAVREIRAKLELNPHDAEALQWLRQIAHSWTTRIRGQAFRFKRLFDYLEVSGK